MVLHYISTYQYCDPQTTITAYLVVDVQEHLSSTHNSFGSVPISLEDIQDYIKAQNCDDIPFRNPTTTKIIILPTHYRKHEITTFVTDVIQAFFHPTKLF